MMNFKIKTYDQPSTFQKFVDKAKSLTKDLIGEDFFEDWKKKSRLKKEIKETYEEARHQELLKNAVIEGRKSVIKKQEIQNNKNKDNKIEVFGGNDFFN